MVTIALAPAAAGAVIDEGSIELARLEEAHTEWIHFEQHEIVYWESHSTEFMDFVAEIRDQGVVFADDGGGFSQCLFADEDLDFRLRWRNGGVIALTARDGVVNYTIEDSRGGAGCESSTDALEARRAIDGRAAPGTGIEHAALAMVFVAVALSRRRLIRGR